MFGLQFCRLRNWALIRWMKRSWADWWTSDHLHPFLRDSTPPKFIPIMFLIGFFLVPLIFPAFCCSCPDVLQTCYCQSQTQKNLMISFQLWNLLVTAQPEVMISKPNLNRGGHGGNRRSFNLKPPTLDRVNRTWGTRSDRLDSWMSEPRLTSVFSIFLFFFKHWICLVCFVLPSHYISWIRQKCPAIVIIYIYLQTDCVCCWFDSFFSTFCVTSCGWSESLKRPQSVFTP